MRVSVVDLGTNSTRLLVADVDAQGDVAELERRSTVTRLGQGLERSRTLAPEARERVFARSPPSASSSTPTTPARTRSRS